MTKTVLIVDDEDTQRQMLKIALQKAGYQALLAKSGREALAMVGAEAVGMPDLILLDLVLGDIDGMEVLEKICGQDPGRRPPVIVLTAHSSVDKAVKAMKAGAVDFIAKPAGVDRLRVSIENALKLHQLSGELSRLSRRWDGSLGFEDLLGDSPVMRRALELARKGAQTNVPVLLEGESGVGKEVFARAIQGSSDRAGKAFVVVNCGAIPANLVESILFGHEKGAFTGATEKHDGKFVEADGGTIFLDEIGELPLDLQAKLLRVLQEGEVDPVGAREPVKIDVRVISATNRNLKELVEAGRFREDLYYRLNVFPILLPPLRDRTGDIETLAVHFVEKISLSEGRVCKPLSPEALKLLTGYYWPGNVRQLENAIFRAVILSEGNEIGIEDFPQLLSARQQDRSAAESLSGNVNGFCLDEGEAVESFSSIRILDDQGEIRPISEVENDIIRFALRKYGYKMSEVARRLGIGRSTLYRKVGELDPDREPGQGGERSARRDQKGEGTESGT
ncbi:sigma-54-dependent transcriptional regulator [Luteithermobacter gelatinilyticus]|uniref:sigma-54-dependent transcriptional regulator n=1 Tax=Luteithermobacter gelatinilyticus TaxID=2582913 RepID=UPI001106FDC7|nr:sigma-54 dependent transcriptional regulator [Luteithermobacter gelatinilyticus]